MELRNQFVRFRIADVYLPDPLIILSKLHGEDTLEGRVIEVSDSDGRPEQFAVIEVPTLEQMIIVPLEKILDVQESDPTTCQQVGDVG